MTPSAAATASSAKPEAGVKETVESIVVAFILAFIFRCFIVEAFVIPTGSMAPTLMGAHLSFRCPDCGYRFTASYPDQNEGFSVPVSAEKTYGVMCPNCGMRLPRSLPDDPANDAYDPAVRYGDRILVMKYLYLLHPARRWDVVVFKTPDPPPGMAGDYTTNYIKRLCGLPGERLFVADGDLYVSPDTGQPPKESDFIIRTKTRPAQDALWRIVYDADYVPVGLPRQYVAANGAAFGDPPWRQPWTAADGGWTGGDPEGESRRTFTFDNPAGAGSLRFDPTAVPNTAPLTDWLAYDQTDSQPKGQGDDQLDKPSYAYDRATVRPVGDLKLSATVERFAGDGAVRLVVGKQHDSAAVEFAAEVGPSSVKLIKTIGKSSREIGQTPLPSGRPTVEIQNVDYRVSVLVNGQERLSTVATDYAPDIADVVRRAKEGRAGPAGFSRIDGDRCTATLSNVRLWRDVYYRDTDSLIQRGTAVDFPANVVTLGKDEYFTMGDNSYRSSDGRYWTQDVKLEDERLNVAAGIVPDRFLLGRAFFVYWPAGFRAFPQSLPINPPLLPNFGEMRFIR